MIKVVSGFLIFFQTCGKRTDKLGNDSNPLHIVKVGSYKKKRSYCSPVQLKP